jgi:hypothetical protein
MNKLGCLFFIVIILSGCEDKRAEKKAILDSVLKVHDKVMAADGELNDNKMKMDTLVKQGNLTAKDSGFMLREKLIVADSVMYKWMNNFDIDQKDKSDDESIVYMRTQKKLIIAIDSQLNAANDEAKKYLSKTKKK